MVYEISSTVFKNIESGSRDAVGTFSIKHKRIVIAALMIIRPMMVIKYLALASVCFVALRDMTSTPIRSTSAAILISKFAIPFGKIFIETHSVLSPKNSSDPLKP